MNPHHALELLRKQKRELDAKIEGWEELQEAGEPVNPKERTRWVHERGSIRFAIDVLEEYE